MRLKIRWARFFTLLGWNWQLSSNPSFDFLVTYSCLRGDCSEHKLLVRICEKTHEALVAKNESLYDIDSMYGEPHPALFGDGPANTHWQMACGNGGGYFFMNYWGGMNEVWEQAAHD